MDGTLRVSLQRLSIVARNQSQLFYSSPWSHPLITSMTRIRVIINYLLRNDVRDWSRELPTILKNTGSIGGAYEAGLQAMMDVLPNDEPKYLLSSLEHFQDFLSSFGNKLTAPVIGFVSKTISNSFFTLASETDGSLVERILRQAGQIIELLEADPPRNPDLSNSTMVLHGALLSLLYGFQRSSAELAGLTGSMHKWIRTLRSALSQELV